MDAMLRGKAEELAKEIAVSTVAPPNLGTTHSENPVPHSVESLHGYVLRRLQRHRPQQAGGKQAVALLP